MESLQLLGARDAGSVLPKPFKVGYGTHSRGVRFGSASPRVELFQEASVTSEFDGAP